MAGVGTPLLWIGFLALVGVLLVADLGLFWRKPREVTLREAAAWTMVWTGLAMGFAGFVFVRFGPEHAAQFVAGYVVEEALSVDNLFVFSVILTYFAVPRNLQHGLLFWGIIGALVLRGVFIGTGSVLLNAVHWMIHVFGAVLVVTAAKLVFAGEDEVDPEKNYMVRLARRLLPISDGWRGERFFVREGGKWFATPLFVVLVAIEFTDILFAIDSIPAVLAVTSDAFIVYTSNIFAILGLRSLYFLVAILLDKFHYLKTGVAVLLAVIGGKMLLADYLHVTGTMSLVIIVGILGTAMVASLVRARSGRTAPD